MKNKKVIKPNNSKEDSDLDKTEYEPNLNVLEEALEDDGSKFEEDDSDGVYLKPKKQLTEQEEDEEDLDESFEDEKPVWQL